ncbi:hypothetical protein [Mesorhizobium sp.]|uniref:hypothetical protein n=1 Tax=Mesorhizobium sp. TaxID=1871066 RepID=UPI000FE6565E|nr:hypothetical protein [Mesorhizobium sp.]RWI35474.1 MAG: hypothetical protein EOR14_28645 [Mesorhizobium sp.]
MKGTGRRVYGAIYTRSDGRSFYLAWRRARDMFRDGEPTNSDAIRHGKASWALDYDTLIMLRNRGVRIVGILEKESEDIWLTTLDNFLSANMAPPRDYSRRGGAVQRYMPTFLFKRKSGVVRI